MARPDVGVIGTGSVGQRFVEFLADDGFAVTAFDIDEDALEAAVEAGATAAESAADLTSAVDVVMLSLPGKPYVETAMEGPSGVLDALDAGQVVVDTGTTPPDVDRHYQALCADRDAGYLDAGITGGGPGPRYTMFVGGKEEHYEIARPAIECVSSQHDHFGRIGNGHVVKAAHRAYQNLRAAVDAEVVELLRNSGIDPERVDELLELGVRDALFEEEYSETDGFESAVAGEPTDWPGGEVRTDDSGARTRLRSSEWAKDPVYALRVAQSTNSYVPLLTAALQTQLAAENIAGALSEREIEYFDEAWRDRRTFRLVYRALNRPGAEWASLARQSGVTEHQE